MIIKIDPSKDLIFDCKVREQCKSCKRYGHKASCPPYVEDINYYSQLLTRYTYGYLVIKKFIVDPTADWKSIGKDSSLYLQTDILKRRESLRKEGKVFISAFGAGSCKLCDKCSFPCIHPDTSLVPLEATGMDVVKLLENVSDIKLRFPITDIFYRVGAIFYD